MAEDRPLCGNCRHVLEVHSLSEPRDCLLAGCKCKSYSLARFVPEDTRLASWDEIQSAAPNLREAVFRLIDETPRTTDEIEALTGLRHQTASARVYELHKSRRIYDSGERRKTRSGRKAIVWTSDVLDTGQGELFEATR